MTDPNKLVKLLSQPRITLDERRLLKSVFADRDELFVLVRNLFFGFEITEEEAKVASETFKSPEVRRLLRKIFLPELQKDIPIGQNFDLWQTKDIQSANKETIGVVMETKKHFFTLVETALALLENPQGPKNDLTITLETELPFIMARNSFVNYIDNCFNQDIIPMVSAKEETPEEAVVRLRKDSAK